MDTTLKKVAGWAMISLLFSILVGTLVTVTGLSTMLFVMMGTCLLIYMLVVSWLTE